MPQARLALLIFAAFAGCGGGSSGDDDSGAPGASPNPATTINSRLAIGTGFPNTAAVGRYLLVSVSESESGRDLNGDGDLNDRVAHRIDTVTDVVTSLELAVVGALLASDRNFAFLVVEAGLQDLNGDGDRNDAVWHVFDPRLGRSPQNPFNTGLASPGSGLAGIGTTGGFVLLESEAAAGQVRNGDGDLLDEVVRVFDDSAMAVAAVVPQAHAIGTPLIARNGRVLFALSETGEGRSLNGDADSNDIVLGSIEMRGTPRYQGIGGPLPRAIANHPYALTDGEAVYFIDEASDNQRDLNSDNDTLDAVFAVYDLARGTGESIPRATSIASFGLAGAPSLGLAAGPDRCIVALSEQGQGARDLNGDLDNFDSVVAWVDTTNASFLHILPLAFGVVPAVMDSRRALVAVNEFSSNAIVGIDLNNDGDVNDDVAHVIDTTFAPGVVVNLQRAVATLSVRGDDALLGISEAADGNRNLNGDGDTNDIVLSYYDLAASPATQGALGIVASASATVRVSAHDLRIATLSPEGQSARFDDLNGDGDRDDFVVQLFRLDSTATPPATLPPSPFPAGTATFFQFAPLPVGNDVFAFPTSEAMIGSDLNGDGDTVDTILSYVRIAP